MVRNLKINYLSGAYFTTLRGGIANNANKWLSNVQLAL